MNLFRRRLHTDYLADERRVLKKVTWAQLYFGRSGEVFSFIVAKELDKDTCGSFYRGRRRKVLNFVLV